MAFGRVLMWNAIGIFVGSGLGGLARWGLSGFIAERFGHAFPWGTLIVNVSGSFLIGLLATLTGPEGRFLALTSCRQFFLFGVLGGYTTFSSFSLQTWNLAGEGQWFRAGMNVVLSVVLCLVGVWLGHSLGLVVHTNKGP
jgi:fluoride exporter